MHSVGFFGIDMAFHLAARGVGQKCDLPTASSGLARARFLVAFSSEVRSWSPSQLRAVPSRDYGRRSSFPTCSVACRLGSPRSSRNSVDLVWSGEWMGRHCQCVSNWLWNYARIWMVLSAVLRFLVTFTWSILILLPFNRILHRLGTRQISILLVGSLRFRSTGVMNDVSGTPKA
jgi:hypothetical protein